MTTLTPAPSQIMEDEAAVRQGFLRKVFGLVAMQLAITAGMCALAMYVWSSVVYLSV